MTERNSINRDEYSCFSFLAVTYDAASSRHVQLVGGQREKQRAGEEKKRGDRKRFYFQAAPHLIERLGETS